LSVKPINIFTGSKGLNTVKDPTRLSFSKNGISDLAVAGDVDISDTGRISRRKGFTQRIADVPVHSLFCDGGSCLFVTGTSLCSLNPDYTYTILSTVTDGARLSCTQINERIYWLNGNEKGYVSDGSNYAWEKGTYIGPDIKRNLSDPPTGTIVAHYRNRMYIAQKNVLWYSEPGAYGAFDLVRGFFMYATDIKMVRPVEDGIYVSSSKHTYFLKGNSPLAFEQDKVADYPAIQWSDANLNGALSQFNDGGSSIIEGNGHSAMWMSNEGICYGGPGGFKNLTLDKIADFPDGLTGSGLVYNKRYIGLINP